MEQETNKSLIIAVIITFVVAFWLGFFVGWLITGRTVDNGLTASQWEVNQARQEQKKEGGAAQMPQKSFSANGNDNTIQGEDQLAGNVARVASVMLDREGWVVIHEENEGKPGAILGAAWLPAGSHEEAEVGLLRGMEAGRRYYAMLHHEVDNGAESHVFDLEKDLPMQDAQGAVIAVSFETVSSPN